MSKTQDALHTHLKAQLSVLLPDHDPRMPIPESERNDPYVSYTVPAELIQSDIEAEIFEGIEKLLRDVGGEPFNYPGQLRFEATDPPTFRVPIAVVRNYQSAHAYKEEMRGILCDSSIWNISKTSDGYDHAVIRLEDFKSAKGELHKASYAMMPHFRDEHAAKATNAIISLVYDAYGDKTRGIDSWNLQKAAQAAVNGTVYIAIGSKHRQQVIAANGQLSLEEEPLPIGETAAQALPKTKSAEIK